MIITYRPGTKGRTVVSTLAPRKEIIGTITAGAFKPLADVRVTPLMLASVRRYVAGK